MFRFANSGYLNLMFVLLIVIGIFAYAMYKRNANLKKFGNIEILRQFMPGYTTGRYYVKFGLLVLAFICGVIIIARPQFGTRVEKVKHQGVEVMIAMDVSNSMLAEDIQPNRLERSKQMIYKFVDGMENDKMGLIVFAGQSFTQLPITSDYGAAKMYASNVTTDMMPTQGTAIGSAIRLAVRSFSSKENIGRSIIIITDGENHEDDAVAEAKKAAEQGIQVNVIGIGNPDGSPIPNGNGSFMKDKSGQVVMTKLNEQMCQQIAEAGNGLYVHANMSNNALKSIQEELNKASTGEKESDVMTDYDEQFQIFAIIALILLLIEIAIREKKNKFFSKLKLFN